MGEVADERRIRKLPVIGSESERTAIDLAVTLWMARHGDTGPITANARGAVLASICAGWRATEVQEIRAARG